MVTLCKCFSGVLFILFCFVGCSGTTRPAYESVPVMYDNSIYKIPAGVYFDTDGNRHIEVAERWSLSDNQLYDSMSDTNESVSTEGGRSYTFKDVVIYTMFSVGVIIALCGLGVLCLVRFFKGGPDISNEPY